MGMAPVSSNGYGTSLGHKKFKFIISLSKKCINENCLEYNYKTNCEGWRRMDNILRIFFYIKETFLQTKIVV